MKILIDYNLGLPAFGLANAFKAMNYQPVIWQKEAKPAFDMFKEFEPDVYLALKSSLDDRATKKNLDMREKLVALLYEDVSELVAFDNQTYKSGKYNPKYQCDVAYVGNFEQWKLNYILPVIEAEYSVKIYSGDYWPVAQHVGQLLPHELPDAYTSAKVCLNLVSGPDEGFFRITGCGGLAISNFAIEKYHLHGLIANNPTEMVYGIMACHEHNARNSEAIREVHAKHTYLHRAGEIINKVTQL